MQTSSFNKKCTDFGNPIIYKLISISQYLSQLTGSECANEEEISNQQNQTIKNTFNAIYTQ